MARQEQELHSSASRSADMDMAFLDLNSAREEDMRQIDGFTPELIKLVCDHRPFKSMDDLRRVPGMTEDMVDVLLRGGAMVGDPKPA